METGQAIAGFETLAERLEEMAATRRRLTGPPCDLTDAELAALVALIRRAIEQDRFPHAPRLDLLRAALAKLDPKTRRQLKAEKRAASSLIPVTVWSKE